MHRLTIISFLLIAFASIVSHKVAHASLSVNDEKSVRDHYVKMEKVLSNRRDHEALVSFFHTAIHDEASFEMTFSNPAISKGQQTNLKMTKQDYINSFLVGSAQVHDYSAVVEPLEIKSEGSTITALSLLKERGYVLNPQDQSALPQYFESQTLCKSEHVEDNGAIQVVDSHCKTNVSYESAI